MRPFSLSFTPADDDLDGFANDTTASAGVAMPLSATSAGDSMAHLVILTPSGSVTGSYALTGTDGDGIAQTETVATDTVNAVTSTKYFKTLTQVLAPSGIGVRTIDIGWTDDILSQTIPVDWREISSAALYVDISGTIDFTISDTIQNIWNVTSPQNSLSWASISSLATKTADTAGSSRVGATAVRILINSLTAGATIRLDVSQAHPIGY